jgi:hypothetical protein
MTGFQNKCVGCTYSHALHPNSSKLNASIKAS